jgi:hypothetical protein
VPFSFLKKSPCDSFQDSKYEDKPTITLTKRFSNPPTSFLLNDNWVAETSEVMQYA